MPRANRVNANIPSMYQTCVQYLFFTSFRQAYFLLYVSNCRCRKSDLPKQNMTGMQLKFWKNRLFLLWSNSQLMCTILFYQGPGRGTGGVIKRLSSVSVENIPSRGYIFGSALIQTIPIQFYKCGL